MSKAGTTGSCDSDHRSHTKGRQRKFPNKDLQSEQNWHHRFVDAFKPATSIGCQKKSFKSWQRIGCWSQRSPTTSPTQLLERDRTIFKNMPNYPTAPSPSATRHWPCEDCHAACALIARSRVSSATLHFQKPYFLYHNFLKPMSQHGAWIDPVSNPFRS